ncbi:MAG TPA: glycosyltransferase family 39 protein [Thermoanaerobaculia bacterium]|jgi:hypothetical protein
MALTDQSGRTAWRHPPPLSATPLGALIAVHIAVALVMRVFAMLRFRLDSDELQHLHVARGWTQGLVQYRDVYDNHLPLFHLVNAPWLPLAGERADIWLYARLTMVPFAVTALWLTYVIAARLYDRRTAVWCTLAASLMPITLLRGIEFRNDHFTVVFSLAALALCLHKLTPRRAFAIGLLLGASFAGSIKTIVILACLGVALTLTAYVRHERELFRDLAMIGAGLLVVPSLVAGFFAYHGALDDLVQLAIVNNGRVAVAAWRRVGGIGIASFTLVCVSAWAIRRGRNVRREAMIVAIAGLLFGPFTLAVSPLVTERDFLPIYPIAMMFVAATILPHLRILRHAVPALMILWVFAHDDGWDTERDYHRQLLRETVAVTRPGELLLDLKGETVFRPRPTFYALEQVSRDLIARGLIADTAARDVVSRRCYVATRDASFFPPVTRAFLNQHFVSVGSLRVAGQRITNSTFSIAVPGPYTVIDAAGRPLERGTYAAGTHAAKAGANARFVVWSPALERGFKPL